MCGSEKDESRWGDTLGLKQLLIKCPGLWLFWLYPLLGWTATNVLQPDQVRLDRVEHIHYLRDESNRYSIVDWLYRNADGGEGQYQWQVLDSQASHFLYDPATYWLRFELDSRLSEPQTWKLALGWPFLDEVTLYLINAQGQLVASDTIGDESPAFILERYRLPVFQLPLDNNQSYQVLLRVRTTSALFLPLSLSREDEHLRREAALNTVYGIFFGVLLLMALYYGAAAVETRDQNCFWFVAYLLSVVLYEGAMTGFGAQYLWGGVGWFRDHALMVSVTMSLVFGALVVDRFLELHKRNPFAHRLMILHVWLYGGLCLASMILSEHLVANMVQPMGLISCLLVLVLAIWEWRSGNDKAFRFLVAWGILVLGISVYSMTLLGSIPRTWWTEHSLMLGIVAEMTLLSMMLAHHLSRLRVERWVKPQGSQ